MLRWLREKLSGVFSPKEREDTPEEEEEAAFSDEPVALPIEDSIDLHTFSPKETAAVVEEYLQEAHRKGFREVRIIHGRGKGVQRQIIRKVLERHPLVASFADAPAYRGGWGATVAQLKEDPSP